MVGEISARSNKISFDWRARTTEPLGADDTRALKSTKGEEEEKKGERRSPDARRFWAKKSATSLGLRKALEFESLAKQLV